MRRRLSFSHLAAGVAQYDSSHKIGRYLHASHRDTHVRVGGCASLFVRVLVPHVARDRWGALSSARNQLRLDELCVSRNASRSYRPINNKPRTTLHVATEQMLAAAAVGCLRVAYVCLIGWSRFRLFRCSIIVHFENKLYYSYILFLHVEDAKNIFLILR